MSGLVDRLRHAAQVANNHRILNEAANAIDSLQRDRDGLREALHWIGREATREDFEQRWNTVQEVALMALHKSKEQKP